jgi:hypothetical protein
MGRPDDANREGASPEDLTIPPPEMLAKRSA